MLNFKETEIDQLESPGNSPQLGNSIKIQLVSTGESGAEFQPVTTQEPENELENLWTTAKSNDDVYQSVVGAIKEGKRTLPTSLTFKISIGDCSLNNNEKFFLGEKMGV